jgi:hypothetical protein
VILTWLHKEGNWYLLNENQCHGGMQPYPHQSLIWHECPRAEDDGGMYRLCERLMDVPCGWCGETCPSGLAGLWRMHNWESLDMIHFGLWDGSFYGHSVGLP